MEPLALDLTGVDIQGENARIRARGPVTLVELMGVPAWSVTDADLLKRLLADPRVSKSASQHWPALQNGEVGADWPLITWVIAENMFTAYGSDHRRLRKLVSPAFTHRCTVAMQPRIEELVTDLLDKLAATPAGEIVDLREGFAYPVPIQVICELLGVPEDREPALRVCVARFFDTEISPEAALANYIEMGELIAELVAFRRDNPGDDVTSVLTSTRDEDGERLTEKEMIDTIMLVINAGHEITVNLLDQAIFALLTHPAQLAAARAGEVSWAEVVEEALRFESPVAHLPLRYAVEDIEIDGIKIAKGEAILASYAAAGRDPKVHGATADDFDITRAVKDHLARLEATIALPALFERFPGLRLATDPAEVPPVIGFIANGHRSLPVYLTAE
ncbi:cytochrome P450 family protein [Nocardia crassostreae]|uniref:cytochrome P450 family protein n=1 Tax=Nocardia crassostreae TaxID=53428 RepID=UPI0008373DBD|nr:cytochrome P450 [Nocardia crassostreae]